MELEFQALPAWKRTAVHTNLLIKGYYTGKLTSEYSDATRDALILYRDTNWEELNPSRFSDLKTLIDNAVKNLGIELELYLPKLPGQKSPKAGKPDKKSTADQERAKKEKVASEEKQRKIDNEMRAQKETIVAVQKLLIKLGYSINSLDGVNGLETTSAIKAFQIGNSLEPIDGIASPKLLISLQRRVSLSKDKIDFSSMKLMGTGSGFLVNKGGFVVTNAHVIENCDAVSTAKDSLYITSKVDVENDVAILQSSKLKGYKPISISDEDPVLGQKIYPSGYPLYSTLSNLNFTSGTVSSEVGFRSNTNNFQMTAPIQPGNSGGPILNDLGGLVGITVSSLNAEYFREQGVETQNVNFGINRSTIVRLLQKADIKYDEGNDFWFSASDQEIAEVAKRGTVLIKCWANKD
tara:strand:- start:75 stop:1298 length:1224 start_codon:yes stop_codon:yes gene_type:complete